MKTLLSAMALVVVTAASGWAVTYTGSLSSSAGGGLLATQDWAGGTSTLPNAILTWSVTDSDSLHAGLWVYSYVFDVTRKGISHVITEVSENFTAENIKAGTTANGQLDTYNNGDPGKSNPGIPGDLFGIKWDTSSASPLLYSWVIVSDREPMWGDFYSKDGKTGGNDVYAFNTGFGNEASALIGDGNAFEVTSGRAWALVPDTDGGGGGGGGGNVVPEPGTFILLGAGLLGFGLYGRRKAK